MCMLNSGNKIGDSGSVLDPFRRLDTTGHVHRPRVHAPHGFANVRRIQATGKDQGHRQRVRDQRPVEGFAASTIALHEGIQEKPLGTREGSRVFYQIKPGPHPRRLDVGQPETDTIRLFLIAMELQNLQGHVLQGRPDEIPPRLDEQTDGRHKRRDPSRQLRRPLEWNEPGARGIKDEADGVGAGAHRRTDILFTGQATDLDSGAMHGVSGISS